MLKKFIIALIALVVIAMGYGYYSTFINPKSPKQVVEISKNDTDIKVAYSRPYKKERLIFGTSENKALVPYGQYWRLGANAATSFTVNQTIAFGGRTLEAGSYRLYAIPEADHWQVVLNEEYGAFGYNEPDFSKDVMRVNAAVVPLSTPVDQFTITLKEDGENILMDMRWDTVSVRIPLSE